MPLDGGWRIDGWRVWRATPGLDSLRAGQQIGTYKLVRELGEGGMGSVWLAERIGDDFRKTVAIKVVKRGVDTDEVLRRPIAAVPAHQQRNAESPRWSDNDTQRDCSPRPL